MHVRIRTAVMGLLVFASGMVSSAFAQWSPDATMDLGMGYGQLALGQSALQGTRAIGETSGKASKRKAAPKEAVAAAPANPAALDFRRSGAVTRVVNDRFVAWQSERHPKLRDELRKGIESGQLQAYFREVLGGYGCRADNLADVSTAYYLSLWRIVHGRDVDRTQAAAVRRQMRDNMARDRRLVSLSDAEKQEISETFALHTALALQGYEQLRGSGDKATLSAFRKGLQARLAPQGPRIDALSISDMGFVSR